MRRNPVLFHILVDSEYYESLEHYQPATGDFHDRVRALLPPRWQSTRRGPWFSWRPPCADLPPQGWKIHVSSALDAGVATLDAVVPICAARGVSFKHALDRPMLGMMDGKSSSREQGGKFITIYPRRQSEFLALLDELSAATGTFDGPLVLTDRRYQRSRVVQYRYGGISPLTKVDVTGRLVSYLVSPDGELVKDERRPEFRLPPWVADPHPEVEDDSTSEPSLKSGRYVVQVPLNFTNAGGIYIGVDRTTEREVIIKETRPYILAGGRPCTEALENEWTVLTALRGEGIAPEPIDLFQDWEHWFLVEERIEGSVLTRHSAAHSISHQHKPTAATLDAFWRMYRTIFANLARALERLHARGFVFGDLSSSNVMVGTETLATTLIDPETVHPVGTARPPTTFTLGFVPRDGAGLEAPSQARDRYALGAMMVRYLLPMEPLVIAHPEILGRFLAELTRDFALPQNVDRVIRGLLDATPDRRTALSAVAEALDAETPSDTTIEPDAGTRVALADLVEGSMHHVMKSASFERRDRLFPANAAVFETNPLCIAYGACGVAHALQRVLGACPPSVVDWILSHRIDPRSQGPGLYSGLAGLAWVLHDLGRHEEAEQAIREAVNHPRLLDAADLFNGASGVGLAALALFVKTGRADFLEYSRWCAEELLARAEARESGLCWQAPDGQVYYGMGFGASGVALFLLSLHLATRDPRWLREGQRALAFDLAGCIRLEQLISWPYRVGSPGPRLPYLEFGAAGVGAAVLRYHLVSPSDEYRVALEGISNDVVQKYAAFPGYLMGLAGLGQFFVDWAVLGGDDRAWTSAHHVADGIRLVALERDGGYAFGTEHFFRIACDFGTGSAGIALFLDNLARGRTSSFMLDELLPVRAVTVTAASPSVGQQYQTV
jgi:hypothetical protein